MRKDKTLLQNGHLPSSPTGRSADRRPGGVRSVCVFCGSGKGKDPAYAAAARALGKHLAKEGVRLVYGGGSLGLMGEVAKSVLKHGGEVTGIIPTFLTQREQMLKDAQELIVTKDMHERKRLMFDRSDAFIALPGGIGTLEELVEQLTWSQLGRHAKPIVLVSVDGFWKPLLTLLEHMRAEAFIRADLEVRFEVTEKPGEVLPIIRRLAPATGTGPVAAEEITSKF